MRYPPIVILVLVVAAAVVSPIVWAVPPAGPTWDQTDSWFRDDDGSETAATGYGASNVAKNTAISDVAASSSLRLRLALKVTDSDGTIAPRLEYAAGVSCTSGTWTVITASSANFILRLSPHFADGDSTTKQIATGGFVAGKILESTNPASPVTVAKNKSTEYEWSLKTADDVPVSTTYAFRVTDNGSVLQTYSQCLTLTTSAPSSVIRGFGDEATVTFSGRAYPGALVSVVAREGGRDLVISRVPVTAADGNFLFTATNVSRWYPTYGIVVSDVEGRRAQVKNYNLDTYTNAVIIKEIFASPTVSLARPLVTRGDFMAVAGAATPGNKVTIAVDGQPISETTASADGIYRTRFATTGLDFGSHVLQARQHNQEGRESDHSPQALFTVSEITVPRADLNGDGILTIGDWSIFLGRWRGQSAALQETIDLNGDGRVTISDFSIFIRAFHARLPKHG